MDSLSRAAHRAFSKGEEGEITEEYLGLCDEIGRWPEDKREEATKILVGHAPEEWRSDIKDRITLSGEPDFG